MVIPKLPKLEPWVRFPSPAPLSVVWRRPVLPQDATSRIAQFPQPRYGCNRSIDRILPRLGPRSFSMVSSGRHRPSAVLDDRRLCGVKFSPTVGAVSSLE
jgi:hypothetical protein